MINDPDHFEVMGSVKTGPQILIKVSEKKVRLSYRLEILPTAITSDFSIFSDTVCHNDIYDILENQDQAEDFMANS